jgi:hypothetical protein
MRLRRALPRFVESSGEPEALSAIKPRELVAPMNWSRTHCDAPLRRVRRDARADERCECRGSSPLWALRDLSGWCSLRAHSGDEISRLAGVSESRRAQIEPLGASGSRVKKRFAVSAVGRTWLRTRRRPCSDRADAVEHEDDDQRDQSDRHAGQRNDPQKLRDRPLLPVGGHTLSLRRDSRCASPRA